MTVLATAEHRDGVDEIVGTASARLLRRVDPAIAGSAAVAGLPDAVPARLADLIPARLAGVVRPATEPGAGAFIGERVLPVLPELGALLPGGGLRRGSTVAVLPAAPATTTVLFALLAAASRAGSWCGVVGLPALNAIAAAQIGVVLDRLALVPHPGAEWATVVAALLDGFDIVVAAPPGPVAATVAGRLAARARQRGGVLVPYGSWRGADLVIEAVRGGWRGLDAGRGRLRWRELTIRARGRGAASVPREVTVQLPGPPPMSPVASAPGSAPAGTAEVLPFRRPAGTPAGADPFASVPGAAVADATGTASRGRR